MGHFGEWLKEHPWETGFAVFGVGVVLILLYEYYYGGSSKSTTTTGTSGTVTYPYTTPLSTSSLPVKDATLTAGPQGTNSYDVQVAQYKYGAEGLTSTLLSQSADNKASLDYWGKISDNVIGFQKQDNQNFYDYNMQYNQNAWNAAALDDTLAHGRSGSFESTSRNGGTSKISTGPGDSYLVALGQH